MSKDYSIYSTLHSLFTKENIHSIIQEASDKGFIYLIDYEDRELFDVNMQCFTIEQAVAKILKKVKEDGDRICLYVKYQDTAFFFWLYEEEEGKMNIGISSFCMRWDKLFEYDKIDPLESIDFPRYIRLLLSICPEVSLLELVTYSDLLERVDYNNFGCVVGIMPSQSFIDESVSGYAAIKGRLLRFIWNGLKNNFIFCDQNISDQVESSLQEMYNTFLAGSPCYIYAKKDDIPFKIEIKRDEKQHYDFIALYPLEPYRMQKNYVLGIEKIDGAFYIERLLELCEHFSLYGVRTFL